MEIRAQEAAPDGNLAFDEDARRQMASETMWHGVALLWRRRRFIASLTGVTAIAAVVIALLLPRWYAAEARVLKPEGGGLSLLGMVDRATGGLGSLFGGASAEYTRYLAILTSRTMLEQVVEEFDLVEVYGLQDSETQVHDAVEELADNLEFEVSRELDYLGIRAFDRDPERAAAMANFLVGALNRENSRLNAQNARLTRLFIERRLKQAQVSLDSIRGEIQVFQETSGVVELAAQAEAFMGSMANLRAEVVRAEVQYQALAQQYGPDNPRVQAARSALEAARAQVNQALGGRDALMPIAMQDLPAASRRYAELLQAQLIHARILETIYPLYEQSLFQEQRDAMAVQVLDEAIPPIKPARPSRRLIVVAATLSALLISCTFVLAQAWLRRNYSVIARRLEQAA